MKGVSFFPSRLPAFWCIPVIAALASAADIAPAQEEPEPTSARSLDARRIAALPATERAEWTAYLEASREAHDLNRNAMAAELGAAGLAKVTPARKGTSVKLGHRVTEEWLRTAEARRTAGIVRSFQTPSGGWSKRLDLQTRPRRLAEGYSSEGEWAYVATIDNGATTGEIRFLARAYGAHGDPADAAAVSKGLAYLFHSQFPNGCWPQVFPLQGGYHDAITFNDDAVVVVLELLREVARGDYPFLSEGVRRRAQASVDRGVRCILDTQVTVNGERTAWGAQHDPLTLLPVRARAYEHASLSGAESAGIVEFLMGLENPPPRVVEAVHAAAAWFRATAITGFEYASKGGLVRKEGAGPIWARFYEIGTNRPIFSNRDGVIRYDWHELEDERRYGYAWYSDDPATTLRRYARWVAK